MKVKIVCIGKIKEDYFAAAVAEYAKRLSRFCTFETCEENETLFRGEPSQKQIKQIIQTEGERLLAKAEGFVVVCDSHGEKPTSEEFSQMLTQAKQTHSTFSFVVGGSYGLSDDVKKRADKTVSFGNVTLPHTLARVVLAEQIYRAFMIENNTAYHK